MDGSDLIKQLRDKTVYYNIRTALSTQQSRTGALPQNCGPNNSTFYQFTTFEEKYQYFNGRYNSGTDCAACGTCSTCTTYCLQ